MPRVKALTREQKSPIILLNYVEKDCGHETECWVYNRREDEYNSVYIAGTNYAAHRFFYENHVGQIPSGLHIDHLCRVKGCVNPSHLEPVTAAENARRATPFLPPRTRKRGTPIDAFYSETLLTKIDTVADNAGIDRASVIRQAVVEFMERKGI